MERKKTEFAVNSVESSRLTFECNFSRKLPKSPNFQEP